MKKILLTLNCLLFTLNFANANLEEHLTDTRKERLEICTQAYNEVKDFVDSKWIHKDQSKILRCATYMTLIYAYESGYGQSSRCKNDKNCFGIKEMTYKKSLEGIKWRKTTHRFLVFDNYRDNNLVFARLYFRRHFNKTIPEFVYGWSHTDRGTYIDFMRKRYWKVYTELKDLTLQLK